MPSRRATRLTSRSAAAVVAASVTFGAAVLGPRPAHAVTFYSTLASFQAAATTALETNFESLAGAAAASPIVLGRLTFTSTIGPLPFYILKPGNPGDVCCTFPHVTSAMLSGNGNEDWDITVAAPPITAMGFDVTTNNTGVTVTVYDAGNVLIGTTTVAAHNVATYVGMTSGVAIGRVHVYSVDLPPPSAQNSAIDNVRIGDSVTTPVQPTTWGRIKLQYR